MPAIVQDTGILQAARDAVEVLLAFKGTNVALKRKGTPIAKPGGGTDMNPGATTLAPQKFTWSQSGDDIVEDSDDGDTTVVKRNYVLTGRYNVDIQPNDEFEDAEATYLVETVNAASNYKTSATLVGFVKLPG